MEADPATVLEWLQMDSSDTRELQLMALEQLCSDVLFSDNVDVFFERYQPLEFLPALCKIFLDETVPDSVLEADARAITYYLDLSNECSRRVVQVSGALRAISARLEVVDMSTDKGNELGQQIIKLLQIISIRESTAIYESGGLTNILNFAYNYSSNIHNDTLLSAMETSAKLCSKCAPTDKDLPIWVNRLSSFLDYETNSVADVVLKCFSNLVERFNRQGFEPTKIASDELLNQIIIKFKKAAGLSLNDDNSLENASENQFSATQVENLSNLILAFCRGSQELMARFLGTKDLCSTLADMISYQSDLMVGDFFPRLVETLLLLLFNGHRNSPTKKINDKSKNSESATNGNGSTWRKDITLRTIVESIRSKETATFMDIFEKAQLHVDCSDEMGQTLLNWACAFGTRDMVEYLLANGADVNKGTRSSSLHYAACFGRPEIVRVLLQFDANPNLQDEEGKLPIDKARDKASSNIQSSVMNSSGAASNMDSVTNHQEVIQILSVADCYRSEMIQGRLNEDTDEDREMYDGDNNNIVSTSMECEESPLKEEIEKEQKPHVTIMDPEVQMMFLKKLMPVVLGILKDTLNSNVKRNSLSLLKKMTQFANKDLLQTISAIKTNNVLFSYSITQAVFTILTDNEDENILLSLEMSKDLLTKCPNRYINSFVRVGLIPRIQHVIDLTYPAFKSLQAEGGQCLIDFQEPIQSPPPEITQSELYFGPFVWCNWSIVGYNHNIYIFNTHFIIDYDFETDDYLIVNAENMFSCFQTLRQMRELHSIIIQEANLNPKITHLFPSQIITENNEPTQKIYTNVEALLRKEEDPSNAINKNKSESNKSEKVTGTRSDKYVCCIKINKNKSPTPNLSDKNDPITIKLYGDKSCIICKSEDNSQHFSFNEDMDFTPIQEKGLRPKYWHIIVQKMGVDASSRSSKLHNMYKRSMGLGPHQDFIRCKIYQIAMILNEKIMKHQKSAQEITSSTNESKLMFTSEPIASTSNNNPEEELADSILDNIKQLAVKLTSQQNKLSDLSIKPIILELENLLQDEMSMTAHELIISGLLSAIYQNQNEYVRHKLLMNDGLISKCVEALEQIEQLPSYSYLPQRIQQLNNGSNFHPISKPLKLQMYQLNTSDRSLYNATNHILRVKPLVTISQIHRFLMDNLSRKWYDYPRSCLHFKVDETFDTMGLFEYLGRNGGTLPLSEWQNPISKQLIRVATSDGFNGPSTGRNKDLIANYNQCGNTSHLVSEWSTANDLYSWIAIDLGVYFSLSKYKFRIPTSNYDICLVAWDLCGSNDGNLWVSIDKHSYNNDFAEENTVERSITIGQNNIQNVDGYRYIRIMQRKCGNKNGTHELSLCGLELFGTIKSIVTDEEKWNSGAKWRQELLDTTTREKEAELRRTLRKIAVGTRVCIGPNWKWGKQNGGPNAKGTVVSELKQGWVDVKWDNDHKNSYRMGKLQNFDLRLADEESVHLVHANDEMETSEIIQAVVESDIPQLEEFSLSETSVIEAEIKRKIAKNLTRNTESSNLVVTNSDVPKNAKIVTNSVTSCNFENAATSGADNTDNMVMKKRGPISHSDLMELFDSSNVASEETDMLIDEVSFYEAATDAANVMSSMLSSEGEQFDDDDDDDDEDDEDDEDEDGDGDEEEDEEMDHEEANGEEVTETNSKISVTTVKDAIVEQEQCASESTDVPKASVKSRFADRYNKPDETNNDTSNDQSELHSSNTETDSGETNQSFFMNLLQLSSTEDVSHQLRDIFGVSGGMGEVYLRRLLTTTNYPSVRTVNSSASGNTAVQRKRQQIRRNPLLASSNQASNIDKIENNRLKEEKLLYHQHTSMGAVLLSRHLIDHNDDDDDDVDDDDEDEEEDEDEGIDFNNLENRDLTNLLGGLMGRKAGTNRSSTQMRSYKMAALAALASKKRSSKKDKPKAINDSNMNALDEYILDKAPGGMIEPFDPRPGKVNKPLTKTFASKLEKVPKKYPNNRIYLCLRLKLPIDTNQPSTSVGAASNYTTCTNYEYSAYISSISSRSSVSSSRSSSTIANDDDCTSMNSNTKRNTASHVSCNEEYERYCEIWLENSTDCIFKYARKLMSHYRLVQAQLSASQTKITDTQLKLNQSENSNYVPTNLQFNIAGGDIKFRLCYTITPPPNNIPFNTVIEYPGEITYDNSNKKYTLNEECRILSEYDLFRHQDVSERQAIEQLIRILCLLQYQVEKEHENFDDNDNLEGQKHKDVVKAINSVSTMSDMRSSVIKPLLITSLSKKLTKKMQQQLRDPLSVASNSFPDWCYSLAINCRLLLSIDSAVLPLFRVTAFGSARAITWLQANRHSLNSEERGAGRNGGTLTNIAGSSATTNHTSQSNHYFLSTQDYLGWRLQKEVSCVSRHPSTQFWSDACHLIKLHATKKTELEVMFSGEEGTGLGPTLDFFQQLSLEFTKPSRTMWHNPNMVRNSLNDTPIHPSGGLFPCAMSPGNAQKLDVLENYKILGIVIAKCLQDARRMDLRLAYPLLKLICKWPHSEDVRTKRTLKLDDFCKIYPEIGSYMKKMQKYIDVRKQVLKENNNNFTEDVIEKLKQACLEILGVSDINELHIGMDFTPNSPNLKPVILRDIYKWEDTNNVDDDDNEMDSNMDIITDDTVEIYVERLLDFTLFKGIRAQIQALIDGMEQVFHVCSLQLIGPVEFSRLLCGDEQGIVNWTMEELRLYIEPGRGYAATATSTGACMNRPAFQWLLETLLEMNVDERRMFLMFSTGSSTLPPGGLKSLQPRIVVVKRENDAGNENVDGMYPSVNTCLHYLKLPEYSSKSLLRDRLIDAAKETGFHLN